MNTFKSIFQKYDTNKTENFSHVYDRHFTPIRNDVKLLFEIGVNRGGSVRAWKEFFPNAEIVGIDINPECYFEEDRIHIEIGDGTDPIFVENLIIKYGYPDIVIDDGSHFTKDIIRAFDEYSQRVNMFYVIEDIGVQSTSYQNGFYINDSRDVFDMIKQEIEEISTDIKSQWNGIYMYYSICFFQKI